MSEIDKICLLGFGEVGQTLAEDLLEAGGVTLSAWDIKFDDADSIPSCGLKQFAVTGGMSAVDAVLGADLVISAVTAAETVNAARSVAAGIEPGTWYVDMNSASPGMKREAAKLINDAGGKYVEAAVMSPIGPKRIATSILLGGPHAALFEPLARDLGFAGMRLFSDEYGKASAAKMCRSVVVKGVEAILTESLLSARHYGVEDTVVTSLNDLFPGPDWQKLSRYMISRSLEHGKRRAEEMREVARTVEEAGIVPLMSTASAERHDWAALRKDALKEEDLADMLDAIMKIDLQ
ncbi:DUF1932 domain-containing protein [Emcibacter nanhaiensis]|uniref:NAD(P)-dependent oxidoreductase n=1 Tax=Emcibacter nanhaiensis TaxID=1505037 RepID=A0A501PGC9_9PROT|nr:DUF1932 domain-containing protein [Emcibacter nanhaiensis]TPD59062.1 NAD(P)-dependent oxidoreductase [Emcibacter nanhaiensis]